MTKNFPRPSPLFDTLDNLPQVLNQELDSNIPFAKADLKLAYEFLKQYDGNEATFKCYRREIERLIQWS